MQYEEKTFLDKFGRTVIIRNARPEDSADLIEYLKITSGETPYLIREPEEITITKDQEELFIQNIIDAERELMLVAHIIDAERELMLVAHIDGKHVGNCSLMSIAPYKRYSHRCDVAIALYKEYCGCGIGKVMLQAVLDAAKSVGYEQAELEVVAENKNAIAMYEKLGFKKYGTFPNNMKYSDGTYVDAYWMRKKLI